MWWYINPQLSPGWQASRRRSVGPSASSRSTRAEARSLPIRFFEYVDFPDPGRPMSTTIAISDMLLWTFGWILAIPQPSACNWEVERCDILIRGSHVQPWARPSSAAGFWEIAHVNALYYRCWLASVFGVLMSCSTRNLLDMTMPVNTIF